MSIPTYPGTNVDAVIELYGKGNALILPALVYLDFLSEPAAVWGGHYDFTVGGVTWQGLGRSGLITAIDGLEATSSMQASDMMLSLSGADSQLLTIFSDVDRSEYVNRLGAIYGQFCTPDWQPVADCPPFAYSVGIMGTANVSRTPSQDGKGSTRSISLPLSNLFYGRSAAKSSYFTDRDQQARHPGDLFFSFVQEIQETSIPEPWR